MDVLALIVAILLFLFGCLVYMSDDKAVSRAFFVCAVMCAIIGFMIMYKPPVITESVPVTTTEYKFKQGLVNFITTSTKPIQFKSYTAAYPYSANKDQTLLRIELNDGTTIKVHTDKWPEELR
jgi:hypothetical protein